MRLGLFFQRYMVARIGFVSPKWGVQILALFFQYAPLKFGRCGVSLGRGAIGNIDNDTFRDFDMANLEGGS